jgi:NDP-sugar pyrophosphorylase family protein
MTETVNNSQTGDRVRTALLLAAGTGTRLQPLTNDAPKCLTEVNGVPILEQQVRCLEHWGFEHLIVVLGHQGNQIREFLSNSVSDLKVSYIENPIFGSTNNLYSLWLARKMIDRSFLLIECDLFFEAGLLSGMLQPDRIALASPQSWMDGTTVTLDNSQRVAAFQLGNSTQRDPLAYKTVNIYSLSLATWHGMRRCLDTYVSSGRVNDYYEAVLRDMTVDGTFNATAVSFDHGKWYEIDTLEDLRAAERLFANSRFGEASNTRIAVAPPNSSNLDKTKRNNAPPLLNPRPASRSWSEFHHD